MFLSLGKAARTAPLQILLSWVKFDTKTDLNLCTNGTSRTQETLLRLGKEKNMTKAKDTQLKWNQKGQTVWSHSSEKVRHLSGLSLSVCSPVNSWKDAYGFKLNLFLYSLKGCIRVLLDSVITIWATLRTASWELRPPPIWRTGKKGQTVSFYFFVSRKCSNSLVCSEENCPFGPADFWYKSDTSPASPVLTLALCVYYVCV